MATADAVPKLTRALLCSGPSANHGFPSRSPAEGDPMRGVRRGWRRVGGFNGGVPFWTALLNAGYTVQLTSAWDRPPRQLRRQATCRKDGSAGCRYRDPGEETSPPHSQFHRLFFDGSPLQAGGQQAPTSRQLAPWVSVAPGPLGHGCVNEPSDALQSAARMGESLSGAIYGTPRSPSLSPTNKRPSRIAAS